MRRQALAVAVLLAGAPLADAQTPAGGEFRANTFVAGEQKFSSVAMGRNGEFLIVWSSLNQDGSGMGVFGQLYDAFGNRFGGEFQVNTATVNLQYAKSGAVAADRSGNYMVVWTSSAPGQDGSGRGIMGRIFAPWGAPLTSEFQVNSFTPGRQTYPTVAALPGGEFVTVWESAGQDGSSYAVIGRKVDGAGRPTSAEFLVNAHTPNAQRSARVDADAAGNFVVVWMSELQDGSSWAAVGRRFNSATFPLGGEFLASSFTPFSQQYPVVSSVRDGRFAVVWEDEIRDGNRYGVYGRLYDASGAPGAEMQLNVYTIDHQHTPTVSAFGNGSFLAAWYSQDQFGFLNQDILARRVLAGTPGAEILVNQQVADNQFLASSDADEVGNAVVTWTSNNQDGSSYSVYARRYGGLVPWAMAGDTVPNPASNANGVVESGETVVIQPAWRNVHGATLTFDGLATGFSGPAPGVYSILDGAASYGAVANGDVRACGGGSGCYAVRVTSGVRPAEHWDAVLREDIQPPSLGQSKAWSLHVGDSFADMPRTSPFYRYVETVFHHGVMPACASFQFCPSFAVPRDQMAQYVLKARDPHWVPTACIPGQEMFADVPASSPYCRWVEELVRRGVVAGCGGGNYCPNFGVTREALAVYLLATLHGPSYVPPACGAPRFTDLPASSPFCRWVEELARRGVVAGCGGGAYCPASLVDRSQMSVFLSVTFSLSLYGP